MQNPLLFGIIGAVVAAGMLLTELMGHRIFHLQLTSECGVPLWILFATYAALQFLVYRGRTRSMELSDKELATWGKALEESTPKILEMVGEHKRGNEIADALEKGRGIPRDVTLRYIFALAEHLRAHRHDTDLAEPPSPPATDRPADPTGSAGSASSGGPS